MPILAVVFFAVLAFALAASSDWLETRYNRAVIAWERGDAAIRVAARERAARSSVAMWLVGVIAFVTIIEVGWWVLLPEGAGLYFGTKMAMR